MTPSSYEYGNYYAGFPIPEGFKKFPIRFLYNRQSTSTTPTLAECTVPTKVDFQSYIVPNARFNLFSFPWKFYIEDVKEYYILNNGCLFRLIDDNYLKEDFHATGYINY